MLNRLALKLLVLAVLVAVCALPTVRELTREVVADRDVVTLRFWNMFSGPDGRTMLALVRRFGRENPDVRIVMQRMEWGPYYNKLFVAGLGGRGPDVFVVHADVIRRFMRAGSVRAVDDLMGDGGIDAADFDANVWAATADESGRHWGVPLDVHPMGLYYNRKLFREAGIVDADGNARPPANREEFVDALRKLRRDFNGDGRIDRWGYVFTWQRINCYSIIRQFGGSLYDSQAGRIMFDSPENAEGLAFAASLVREELVPSPQNFDAWVGFLQGRVGMAFHGIFQLEDLRRQPDLDYGAAPVPMLGDRAAVWVNSHNLCLRPDLPEKEVEAAKRLVKFLSDNSLDWAAGGQVPVRKSLRDTPRFEEMTAQRQFARQIPYAAYMPAVPFIFEIQSEFDYCIERILRNTVPAAAALAESQQRLERVLSRYQATSGEVGQ